MPPSKEPLTTKVPSVRFMVPLNVFELVRVNVPGPTSDKTAALVPPTASWITPLMVIIALGMAVADVVPYASGVYNATWHAADIIRNGDCANNGVIGGESVA